MKRFLIIISIFFISCSPQREIVMPFVNMVYSGERLFPISSSDAESVIRIWFNNSTSIDRVITISTDTLLNNQGKIVEFGFVTSKGIFKNKKRDYFQSKNIEPKSGFDAFFNKIHELDLFAYKTQEDFQLALHQPFSLYVVEYKKGNKYCCFLFRSSLPLDADLNNNYFKIEKLLMEEFEWEYQL